MINIRKITPAYGYQFYDALEGLRRQLSPASSPIVEEELEISLSDTQCFHLFIAEDEEKFVPCDIVGMAIIFFQWKPSGWMGEIHDVIVDKESQGKGIGKMLTQKLLDTAKERAKNLHQPITLYLTSKPARVAANAMYAKFGFELVAQATGPNGTNLYKMKITP